MKTVWFVSLGYTLSIAVVAFGSIALLHSHFFLIAWLQHLGLLAWALRLRYFILKRERNLHYQSAVESIRARSERLSIGIKIMIWISVSILYTIMFSPAFFTALSDYEPDLLSMSFLINVDGIAILFAGLIIESVADSQKSEFKKLHPKKFCQTGLYGWVRFPNYLGEIMVWTGNFIVAIPFYRAGWHWLIAIAGLVILVLIMLGSAKRLEARQNRQHEADPAYLEFVRKTPVLFPWLPIYSLQKNKIHLGG
ncbi:MAG: DUF1295 domain-containing protein [Chitinophagales bacterium]